MQRTAIKQFVVEEGTVAGSYYEIVVKFGGKVVDRFHRPTMEEAKRDFAAAGYRLAVIVES